MDNWYASKPDNDGERELIDRAVKALEAEFATISKLVANEDAISIQSVIEWLKAKDIIKLSSQEETIRKELKALSFITPQQKIGRWFIDERPECNREVVCSNCDQPIFKYHKLDFDYRPKYCPNCGARMQEVEE